MSQRARKKSGDDHHRYAAQQKCCVFPAQGSSFSHADRHGYAPCIRSHCANKWE